MLTYQPSTDPSLPDGSAGSGVAYYEHREMQPGGSFGEWVPTTPDEPIYLARPASTYRVELRAVDPAGNTGAQASQPVATAAVSNVALPQRCVPAADDDGFPYRYPRGYEPPTYDNFVLFPYNLPNCREIAPGGVKVFDASPIRRQIVRDSSGDEIPSQSRDYRLYPTRGYEGALKRENIIANPAEWMTVMDSFGNAVAYIKPPVGNSKVWAVNPSAKKRPTGYIPGGGFTRAAEVAVMSVEVV